MNSSAGDTDRRVRPTQRVRAVLVIIAVVGTVLVGVVAVGGITAESTDEGVSMATYATNNGDTATVETDGLLNAIGDFRAGEIDTTALLNVIDRFRTGDPVVAANLANATAVDGETLSLPGATFTEGEFAVVVHESNGDTPGTVIGESEPHEPGTVTGIDIDLEEPIESPGEELVAVVHHADRANKTVGAPVLVENGSIASTAFVDVVTAVFDVSGLSAPDAVTDTEPYTAEATVENIGNATGTQSVEYRIVEASGNIDEATATATQSVPLEPGENKTVAFSLDAPGEYSLTPGAHDHGVFTPAANTTAPLDIEASLESVSLKIDGETDTASIGTGETVAYTVTAQFSNGSTEDVTATAGVTSDDPAVASVDETAATVTGEALGENITVTATVDDESDTTNVTVESEPTEFSLAPSAVDVFRVTDQPGEAGVNETFEVEYRLTGAETLTLTLTDEATVNPTHLSFDVGGTTIGVDETYEFDDPPVEGRITVAITVDSGADAGEVVGLTHTLKGGGDSRALDTGPTTLTTQTTAGAVGSPVSANSTVDGSSNPAEPKQLVLRLGGPEPGTVAERATSERLKAHAQRVQPGVIDTVEAMDGAAVTGALWLANAVVVSVEPGVTAEELATIDNVDRVHPNYEYTIPEPVGDRNADVDTTSDTDVTYGLDQINAPDAWDAFGNRGDGVRVAVLDTGVADDHPDIDIEPANFAEFDDDGNEVPGEHCGGDICDTGYHGTHVSGTVVGGNASGEYIGVAPDATLLHGLVLPDGEGTWAQITGGIEWAVKENADVVSMSLGGPIDDELIAPVENAIDAGTVVVASSGNGGSGTSGSPGADRSSLAVGATNITEQVPEFSGGRLVETDSAYSSPPDTYPSLYLVPDVVAPGSYIKSAIPEGSSPCADNDIYCLLSGTSMAAPHVSGAMAVILSNTDGDIDHDEMYNLLAATATKPEEAPVSQDIRFGHGIIDVHAATDAGGTATIVTGTVTDAQTDEPLAGATVTVPETGEQVDTDADGTYELPTHAQNITIQVDAFGYGSVHSNLTVSTSIPVLDSVSNFK